MHPSGLALISRRAAETRRLTLAQDRTPDLIGALDDAALSKFHLRAAVVSGMGFFTDAYDLFVISVASSLIKLDWNLSTGQLALLNATMLGAGSGS